MDEQMKPYRLKAGFTHWEKGVRQEAGATVYLTDNQFQAFKDRFESLEIEETDEEAPVEFDPDSIEAEENEE